MELTKSSESIGVIDIFGHWNGPDGGKAYGNDADPEGNGNHMQLSRTRRNPISPKLTSERRDRRSNKKGAEETFFSFLLKATNSSLVPLKKEGVM